MENNNKVYKIKDLKDFSKYERFYDREDLMLFNSYQIGQPEEEESEIGIMSNIYSGCKIPFMGHIFHSAEQLLFWLNIKRWANMLGYKKVEIDFREYIVLNCKDGFDVKNNPLSHQFFEDIEAKKRKLLGDEKYFQDDWNVLFFCAKLKFIYTPELRELCKKYENKIWAENSFWGDYNCGVIYDKTIKKYRGINMLGRCYRYIWNHQDEIMREAKNLSLLT